MRRKYVECCGVVHNEVVGKVKAGMLPDPTINDLSKTFKILEDPTRIRILWALNQSEMCVCDLATVLSMTKSAVSHQLNTLREAKLVKSRREGKRIHYSLDDQHVTAIIDLALTHAQHQ